MSISLRRVIIRGNTFRVTAEIREYASEGQQGDLFDPDSQAIRLLKPDGTQQGSDMTSPSKDGTGQYHQDVDTPATGEEGEWKVEWEITVSSKKSTERMAFRMVA